MDTQELHKRSSNPLFLQVVSALRRRIESGIWPPGSKIPSLDELAVEFGIARATARQAVTELAANGLIWRKQGKGTFVNEDYTDKRWLNVITNWKDITSYAEGHGEIKQLESADNVQLPYFRTENATPAESYHYIKNLHSKDGQPYGVINVYIDTEIFNKDPKAFEEKAILQAFYSSPEIKITKVHQILTIGAADIDNARLLEIAIDAPTVDLRRCVLSKDKRIMYYADNIFPAELVKIELDVR